MIKALKAMLPAAEAIQRLLHPHAEVVIHDIKKNEIAAIYNAFSKRRVGDPSLLTQEELGTLKEWVGPYEKINRDGRRLKSVSSLIRDEQGQAVGMLCINLDISKLEKVQAVLADFIQYDQFIPQPEPLFKDDWQERINRYVHEYLNKHHWVLGSLKREEKKELIGHLYKIGAFTGKHAAIYIAQVMGVSKATIYNYLSAAAEK